MELEYLLFIWLLLPWMKSLLYYILRKSEKAYEEKQLKRQKRTPLQTMLTGSSVLIFGSIPYIGAYFYADLKTLWVILGAVYLFTGLVLLIMGALAHFAVKYYSEEIKDYENKTEKSTKNVNYWPKWQKKALCLFQYTVLTLWFYSWRHLIA